MFTDLLSEIKENLFKAKLVYIVLYCQRNQGGGSVPDTNAGLQTCTRWKLFVKSVPLSYTSDVVGKRQNREAWLSIARGYKTQMYIHSSKEHT